MTSLLWIYHNLGLETFWQWRFLSWSKVLQGKAENFTFSIGSAHDSWGNEDVLATGHNTTQLLRIKRRQWLESRKKHRWRSQVEHMSDISIVFCFNLSDTHLPNLLEKNGSTWPGWGSNLVISQHHQIASSTEEENQMIWCTCAEYWNQPHSQKIFHWISSSQIMTCVDQLNLGK